MNPVTTAVQQCNNTADVNHVILSAFSVSFSLPQQKTNAALPPKANRVWYLHSCFSLQLPGYEKRRTNDAMVPAAATRGSAGIIAKAPVPARTR